MVEKELLALIVCPETHQPLQEASRELLAKLNERILRGEVKNRSGASLRVALEEALVRADGKVLYPVQDGIPMLLIEEAVALEA